MTTHLKALFTVICLAILPTAQAQERIVTAGGSITEIIYALGADKELVGVDITSTYPEEVKKLPKIGYWKQLSIEGILSLKPSLFITWQDSGPELIFSQLASTKVDVLKLKRVPNDVPLLVENIHLIGDKVNKKEEAEKLITEISRQIKDVQDKVATHKTKPNVMFLFSIQGTTQIAGKNTVADSIISLAGGNNIANHDNYKNYSNEAFITANPDVLVVTSESLAAIGGIDNLSKYPGLTHTNAWKNKKIVAIDQALILGMGPRVGEAITTLYNHFY